MESLHDGLNSIGVESRIIVKRRRADSSDSGILPQVKGESHLRKVCSRLGLNDVHLLGSFLLPRHDLFKWCDVLHIHCAHGSTLSYLAFPLLTKLKPTVFTLHDHWAITGHCASSLDCERWKSGCGSCPYLDAPPAVRRDGTRTEWRLKAFAYRHSRLTLISQSSWTTSLIEQSMARDLELVEIPLGIDTDVFVPKDKARSRMQLSLPNEARVALCRGTSLNDRIKGTDLLVRSLNSLSPEAKDGLILLTMGRHGGEIAAAVDVPVRDLGYVEADADKATAYSAADAFLLPSREESFGRMSVEAQACGTPVVAFATGPIPDHVTPGSTGYLAAPWDVEDLGRGLVQVLLVQTPEWRATCRPNAVEHFSLSLHVRRHLALYRHLISPGRSSERAPLTFHDA